MLATAEYGILSTVGADGEPYGVPLNFVWHDQHIYFHCATSGHKLDNLAVHPRVSFCVVGKTRLLPEQFATEYESAIAFGTIESVSDEEERLLAFREFLNKYSPDFLTSGEQYITTAGPKAAMMKITIGHLTGKHRV